MGIDPTLIARLVTAALGADWQQVVQNGGPPCFHLEGPPPKRFCLRAGGWLGHGDDHEFVSLADLFAALRAGPEPPPARSETEARLRLALEKTGSRLLDGTLCWCPVVADMADDHDDVCREARALLSDVASAPSDAGAVQASRRRWRSNGASR